MAKKVELLLGKGTFVGSEDKAILLKALQDDAEMLEVGVLI